MRTNFSSHQTTIPDDISDTPSDIPVPPTDDIDQPRPIEEPPENPPDPTRPDKPPVREPGPDGPKKIV
ncbi:MAG TPA: hypothetical protein VFC63_20200 [Blastocatellia bacterium]|nr:hypothetical protein [Blastocatellia bacterium]